ncbi:MAG: hypothetical protein N3E51_03460 [Candidatus Micrarchaeota archaeon]|nr:hypothetical protein [Candidatus Micrarchaeota archaeon]
METCALIDTDKLASFIGNRLNSDGGYGFARRLYGFEFPSSISETYYALGALSFCGCRIPSKAKTVAYLERSGVLDCAKCLPSAAFHTIGAFLLLGKKPDANPELVAFLERNIGEKSILCGKHRSFWLSADYGAADSPFSRIFYSANALRMLGKKAAGAAWLVRCLQREGGFGAGRADVVSTYHALSALLCAGGFLPDPKKTADFVERCSVASGGYSMAAGGAPAFVETTFFALFSLAMLGEKPKSPEKHIRFIASLQNSDGGFRRSAEMGVSTLANSYYAVGALECLSGDCHSKTHI